MRLNGLKATGKFFFQIQTKRSIQTQWMSLMHVMGHLQETFRILRGQYDFPKERTYAQKVSAIYERIGYHS